MENLMLNRRDLQTVPESNMLTQHMNTQVPLCDTIPLIDLKQDFSQLIHQIIDASTEFGFFQLLNHGIEEKLLEDVLRVSKEFFNLPDEDRSSFNSHDTNESCRLYTRNDYMKMNVHNWRHKLRLLCHPLEEHMPFWPEKPARYREVIGRYSVEVRKLSLCLVDLIGEGLGLGKGYFADGTELSKQHSMAFNHYPPCPNSSSTLGLFKHSDPNLITLLLQDMDGLQILRDGQWLAVKPLPNSFVVNIGYTLQIVSNGKLRSVEHRVVTNQKLARTAIGSFISPSYGSQIEPAKSLVNGLSPPLYRAVTYQVFLDTYKEDILQNKLPIDRYKLGF